MSEDTMFQEAIGAIEKGERNRARDLLTRLLRADKENPDYWLWMSSVVETPKEQIYCLQSVLRLDPDNQAAQKGLILLGAEKPEDDVQPAPFIKRKWEVTLQEVPKQKFFNRPAVRIALLALAVIAFASLIALGVYSANELTAARVAIIPTSTAGPSPTFTYTPTPLNFTPQPPTAMPTFSGPPPLWTLLDATYTPTPFTVNTPHVSEAYRVALDAFGRGDFATALSSFQQLLQSEPNAADVHYYMGEIYYTQGEYQQALDAYNEAINANPDFAPAYVGKARTLRMLNQQEDIPQLLKLAIEKDPNLGQAYLELISYALLQNDLEAAEEYLTEAENLFPAGSPLIHLYSAKIYIAKGDYENAFIQAQEANQLDRTLLESYRVLAEAAVLNQEYNQAIDALDLYLEYAPEDARAWLIMGEALLYTEQYSQTLEALNRAFELDSNLKEIHLYRGIAYLESGEGQQAVNEFYRAKQGGDNSFEINLYMGRALLAAERYEDAGAQFIYCETIAESDEEYAQVYYWRALTLEAGGNKSAARRDWERLLALPEDAMPEEWRRTAEGYLNPTPTPSPTPNA